MLRGSNKEIFTGIMENGGFALSHFHGLSNIGSICCCGLQISPSLPCLQTLQERYRERDELAKTLINGVVPE